jgi:hypothetical protein
MVGQGITHGLGLERNGERHPAGWAGHERLATLATIAKFQQAFGYPNTRFDTARPAFVAKPTAHLIRYATKRCEAWQVDGVACAHVTTT